MVWFFVAVAVIWALGHITGSSRRARLALIALVYCIALMAAVTLPEPHAARTVIGKSPGAWLLLGILAALAFLYSVGLRWLRERARRETSGHRRQDTFGDAELPRYARHIMLHEIGGPGQRKLKEAKVLVVGAGGLGSPAMMYLAAAGIGTIGVIDNDEVEITNLQRQIAHTNPRIGMPKVFSAEKTMKDLNPFADIRPYSRRLTEDIATELVADYNIVLDGSDNFDTRYLTNRACVVAGRPLVSAALTQWEGQISVFDPANGAPCYQCVFPEAPASGLAPSCAEAGVLGPLPGVLGAMMAVEAVKLIARAGEPLRGRMMIYDALYGETRVIGLKRREGCGTCGVPIDTD